MMLASTSINSTSINSFIPSILRSGYQKSKSRSTKVYMYIYMKDVDICKFINFRLINYSSKVHSGCCTFCQCFTIFINGSPKHSGPVQLRSQRKLSFPPCR